MSGFTNLLYLLFIPKRKHGAEIIIYDFVILLLLPLVWFEHNCVVAETWM